MYNLECSITGQSWLSGARAAMANGSPGRPEGSMVDWQMLKILLGPAKARSKTACVMDRDERPEAVIPCTVGTEYCVQMNE